MFKERRVFVTAKKQNPARSGSQKESENHHFGKQHRRERKGKEGDLGRIISISREKEISKNTKAKGGSACSSEKRIFS